MTTQPEALRLAENFDDEIKWQTVPISRADVAAELRRLHESNTELLAALKLAYNTLVELSFTDTKINATRVKARAAITKAERTTT